jgi:serine/threonine protein kinase
LIKNLAHYEILDKIGQGGMGEVYRARDAKLGREVALKMLPADVAGDVNKRDRLLTEARALASLNHPNIVSIYSVEEAEGVHFLVMELIRGKSLIDEIAQAGMPEDRVLNIALPLTDGLSAAHELGLVHRDLKPSNLMLNHDGQLKILDFGLVTFVETKTPLEKPSAEEARDMPTKAQLTAEGVVLGTMPYMSPEQVEGGKIDARSDIFSLGIILYEMVSGQRPFQGNSPAALMSSILRDAPSPCPL